MATKKIIAKVTLHRPGKGHEPFKIDTTSGTIASGKYVAEQVPPGTSVDLDADEADALIAAKLAVEATQENLAAVAAAAVTAATAVPTVPAAGKPVAAS